MRTQKEQRNGDEGNCEEGKVEMIRGKRVKEKVIKRYLGRLQDLVLSAQF